MSQHESHTTVDHDEIRSWADRHDAVPAVARGTGNGGADGAEGVLTLDLVGYGAGEEELEHVSWEDWLDAFERNQLAFVYQDQKKSGEESTFFRLVDRDDAV